MYRLWLLGLIWAGGFLLVFPAQAEKLAQLSTATPIPSPTAESSGQIIYLVTAGDTLVGIANRFQLNLELLYAYNDLNENSLLTIGQPLILGFTDNYTGTTFLEGYPHARVRPNGLVIHLIQAGETLISIATKYNITLEQLYELNELSENSLLQLNQELLIGITPHPQEVGGSSFEPELLSTPTLIAPPPTQQPTIIIVPQPLATNIQPQLTSILPAPPTNTPAPISVASPPFLQQREQPPIANLPMILVGAGATLLLLAGSALFYIARKSSTSL